MCWTQRRGDRERIPRRSQVASDRIRGPRAERSDGAAVVAVAVAVDGDTLIEKLSISSEIIFGGKSQRQHHDGIRTVISISS